MPNKINLVRCANCNKQQPDEGKRQTCCKCGCSPLPSFSYERGSGLHPEDHSAPVKLTAPPRRAPEPRLII